MELLPFSIGLLVTLTTADHLCTIVMQASIILHVGCDFPTGRSAFRAGSELSIPRMTKRPQVLWLVFSASLTPVAQRLSVTVTRPLFLGPGRAGRHQWNRADPWDVTAPLKSGS